MNDEKDWVDYVGPDGAEWRVTRWQLLLAELPGIGAENLPALHAALVTKGNDRSWFIARHLFGMMPVIPPLSGNPDDARPWSRAEIRGALSISEKDLVAELQALRLGWERSLKEARPERAAESEFGAPGIPPMKCASPAPAQVELIEEDDSLLRKYGWRPAIFNVEGRDAPTNREEKAWFVGQARAWHKLLTNHSTEAQARQCMNIALRLRRLEDEALMLDAKNPPGDARKRLEHEKLKELIGKRISDLRAEHRAALEILHELAPGFGVAREELAITGAIGEVIKGIQEWEARGDKRLIDGIYTACEIQVMLRTSLQMPLPQYRIGKVAFLLDSMRWVWSRENKSLFKERDFAMLEPAFKEAIRALKDKNGLHVPDLRLEGPAGEYEDLHLVDEALKDGTEEMVNGAVQVMEAMV